MTIIATTVAIWTAASVCPQVPDTFASRSDQTYEFRDSSNYRQLDDLQRCGLARVVRDFDELEAGIRRFMADHDGNPPESLDDLAPCYLRCLPCDPFAVSAVTSAEEPPPGFQISGGGNGYLYKRRPASLIFNAGDFSKSHTIDGSWMIMSTGLRDFPLRYASQNSRGLIREDGYWGRLRLDVF